MAGGDLADGLAEFPNVFSSTFVTMVRAGEASGTLELVIERFAEHIEQQVALVRKVQATLAYPILMLFVGIGVVIFLLTFVIPKVTQIFSDMGRALPVPTQILLAVSDGHPIRLVDHPAPRPLHHDRRLADAQDRRRQAGMPTACCCACPALRASTAR